MVRWSTNQLTDTLITGENYQRLLTTDTVDDNEGRILTYTVSHLKKELSFLRRRYQLADYQREVADRCQRLAALAATIRSDEAVLRLIAAVTASDAPAEAVSVPIVTAEGSSSTEFDPVAPAACSSDLRSWRCSCAEVAY